MKPTIIVTPVLLFLMIILLAIAIYINFIFRPLSAKIEEVNMENDLIKVQRMEVELAMLEVDAIRQDIARVKAMLKEDSEIMLIDGSALADDIYAKAKATGILLDYVNIAGPDFADASETGETVLLYATGNLGFKSSYDAAAAFIGSIDNSTTGAYKIHQLSVNRDRDGTLQWNMELHLYYYGSRADVPPAPIESQEQSNRGILPIGL